MVPERVSSTAQSLLGVWGCLSSPQERPILPSALRSPWPLSPASLTLESGAPALSTGSARAQSHEGPSMTLGRSQGSVPSTWGLTPRQTHLEMAGSAGADPTAPSLPAHHLTCGYSQVKVKVGKDKLPLHKQPVSKHDQVSQGYVLLSLSHLHGWTFLHLLCCPWQCRTTPTGKTFPISGWNFPCRRSLCELQAQDWWFV